MYICGCGILQCTGEMRVLKQAILHRIDFVENAMLILIQLSLLRNEMVECGNTSIRDFGILDGPEDSWADI